jgi:hypothetical protein
LKDNKRLSVFPESQDAINKVLQFLGVTAGKRKDEFDTVGLGKYRDKEDGLKLQSKNAKKMENEIFTGI